MDRFIELLTELLGADDPLVEMLSSRGEGDAPYAEVETEDLEAALDSVRALADEDDATAELLTEAVPVAQAMRAELDGRAEAEAAAEAQRNEAVEALRALDGESTDDESETTAESDDEVEADAETTDAETDDATDETQPEPEAQPEPEPVTAAAPPRRTATPRRHRPNPVTEPSGAPLVASSNIGRMRGSQRFDDESALGEAFNQSVRNLKGTDSRFIVANGSKSYDDAHRVGTDAGDTMRKFWAAQEAAQARARDLIERALWSSSPTSPEMRALVADGGVCAPAAPRYDFFETSTADRPIRGALPSFNADRGRVIFTPPTLLDTLNPGVTTVTEDQDAAGNTDKACVSVACPTNTTVELQAIAACLQVGNFNNQFFPEQTAHLLRQLAAEAARTAENNLWASIVADGTAVNDAEELSTTRDFLEALNRYVAYFRDFHRLPDSTVLRVLAPRGFRNMLRADLARQQPGDNTYAVADATMASWFATIGVLVTWTNEANGTFEFTSGQGVGAVQGWPATVDFQIFPEGAHLFLDGGSLDLGMVRDSTLNASNNLQFFSEVWEETAHIGPESWDVTLTICPSGISSGQNDSFDPCPPGS